MITSHPVPNPAGTELRTVAQILRSRAATSPNAPIVKCADEWITLGDLDERSDRAAAGLVSLGVEPGDRIGFFLTTSEELLVLLFACFKVGGVYVPVNIYLKGQFLEYQLADSGTTVLIVDDAGLDAALAVSEATEVAHMVLVGKAAGELPPHVVRYDELLSGETDVPDRNRQPRELAAILYTSGTTGAPKGCMLPEGYLVQLPRAQREGGWIEPGDRVFTSFPMFHISGVSAVLSALINEASVCFAPTFSASTFMTTAKAEGATVIYGVGSMAHAILAQPPSPRDAEQAMRMALWVPLAPEIQDEFESRFRTPVVCDAYGQTEVSPFCMSSVDGQRRRGSVGRCVSYLEIAVVDDDGMEVPHGTVGEIVVRPASPDVFFFLGYWNKPEATAESFRNLWHHTGDSGHVDDDGYVFFVDRKKDSVRRRGENVSSFEVEAAIIQHPAVEAVAVTAVPSPMGEDDIRASVVLAEGADLTPQEIFEFFRDHLPYFAIPRYVDVRDSLPVNALNKVMKNELRQAGVPADAWDLEALGMTVPRDERRKSGRA
jgi:crotonobetaine/carnitine-CoA ligase